MLTRYWLGNKQFQEFEYHQSLLEFRSSLFRNPNCPWSCNYQITLGFCKFNGQDIKVDNIPSRQSGIAKMLQISTAQTQDVMIHLFWIFQGWRCSTGVLPCQGHQMAKTPLYLIRNCRKVIHRALRWGMNDN